MKQNIKMKIFRHKWVKVTVQHVFNCWLGGSRSLVFTTAVADSIPTQGMGACSGSESILNSPSFAMV